MRLDCFRNHNLSRYVAGSCGSDFSVFIRCIYMQRERKKKACAHTILLELIFSILVCENDFHLMQIYVQEKNHLCSDLTMIMKLVAGKWLLFQGPQ